MTGWELFGVVLAVKLIAELVAVLSDNDYLTGHEWRSATLTAMVAAAGIPIGREVIGEGNNTVAAACIVAAFVARWYGCRDLTKRKSAGSSAVTNRDLSQTE